MSDIKLTPIGHIEDCSPVTNYLTINSPYLVLLIFIFITIKLKLIKHRLHKYFLFITLLMLGVLIYFYTLTKWGFITSLFRPLSHYYCI